MFRKTAFPLIYKTGQGNFFSTTDISLDYVRYKACLLQSQMKKLLISARNCSIYLDRNAAGSSP